MRYAIVDNATITAVQRVLGDIEVFNEMSTDGDLAAFENLVFAILFYDRIFSIKDYKEQFQSARNTRFPFIIPIEKNAIPYDQIKVQALNSIADISLRIEAGKVDNNEFGKFLETLKLFTTCTWDMASSNFFLTMKMLEGKDSIGIEKYTKLNEAILTERNVTWHSADSESKPHGLVLLDSQGNPIPISTIRGGVRYDVKSQIISFASSLNWLAMRTSFYTLLAGQYACDVVLHPIRSAFQVSFSGPSGFKDHALRSLLLSIHNETKNMVSEVRVVTDPVISKGQLPVFSAWIAEKTKDPAKIIDTALDLKTKEPFLSARRQLIELEEIREEKNNTKFVTNSNKIMLNLQKTFEKMRMEYGLKKPNGISLSPVIFVFNAALSLKGLPSVPNMPIRIQRPDFLDVFERRSGFQGVIRSIVQDLTAIERLGSTHEILTSKMKFKKDDFSGRPQRILYKAEDERFFGKSSGWKRPM